MRSRWLSAVIVVAGLTGILLAGTSRRAHGIFHGRLSRILLRGQRHGARRKPVSQRTVARVRSRNRAGRRFLKRNPGVTIPAPLPGYVIGGARPAGPCFALTRRPRFGSSLLLAGVAALRRRAFELRGGPLGSRVCGNVACACCALAAVRRGRTARRRRHLRCGLFLPRRPLGRGGILRGRCNGRAAPWALRSASRSPFGAGIARHARRRAGGARCVLDSRARHTGQHRVPYERSSRARIL